NAAHQLPRLAKKRAQRSPDLQILMDSFGDNIPSSRQYFIHARELFSQVCLSGLLEITDLLLLDHQGKRLQAQFSGGLSSRFSLGFIGKVKVLQNIQRLGGADLFFQGFCQFSLLLYGLQNELSAFLQLYDLLTMGFNLLDLNFIECSRSIFSVSSSKRDGRALF